MAAPPTAAVRDTTMPASAPVEKRLAAMPGAALGVLEALLDGDAVLDGVPLVEAAPPMRAVREGSEV